MTSEHTLEHWPEELYIPGPMVDRTNWDQWEMQGSKEWRQRAAETIDEILEDHDAEPIDESIDDEIRRLCQTTCNEPDVELPAIDNR